MMDKLTQGFSGAGATAVREYDERVHAAWRNVYRDVLIATATVGGAVLTGSVFLGTVWGGPQWPSWAWLIATPVLQLYVGVLVGWASIRYHRASTRELERAQQARLLLSVPLVGPIAFLLVLAVTRDTTESLFVAGAAMAGVTVAAAIGYFRWRYMRHSEGHG